MLSVYTYISCPMTVPQKTLDQVIELVSKAQAVACYWNKGTKYESTTFKQLIEKCNAFIVILPNLSWEYRRLSMTSGSQKELGWAISANKPIFIAYESKEGMGIYVAEINEHTIKGIASTKYNFSSLIDHIKGNEKAGNYGAEIHKQYEKEFIKRNQEVIEYFNWNSGFAPPLEEPPKDWIIDKRLLL